MYIPAPDEKIWVGVLRLVLRVPDARSLKDKRRGVSSVKERLRARHDVSVAEVGFLEDHQRAVLAVAMTGNDPQHLRSALDGIRGQVRSWHSAIVESDDVVLLRPHDSEAAAGYSGDDG
jgi:uncharacterized protein